MSLLLAALSTTLKFGKAGCPGHAASLYRRAYEVSSHEWIIRATLELSCPPPGHLDRSAALWRDPLFNHESLPRTLSSCCYLNRCVECVTAAPARIAAATTAVSAIICSVAPASTAALR